MYAFKHVDSKTWPFIRRGKTLVEFFDEKRLRYAVGASFIEGSVNTGNSWGHLLKFSGLVLFQV